MNLAPVTPSNPCFARLEHDRLTIGNEVMERSWRVAVDGLQALTVNDLQSGKSWLVTQGEALSVIAPRGTAANSASCLQAQLTIRQGHHLPVERWSLIAELTWPAAPGTTALVLQFQVFPGLTGVICQLLAWPAEPPLAEKSAVAAGPTGIEVDGAVTTADRAQGDRLEHLALTSPHLHLRQVMLQDRTDHTDQLVQVAEYRLATCQPLSLSGNLFVVEDPLTKAGIVLLKLAPLPHARPCPSRVDLQSGTFWAGTHWTQGGQHQISLLGHGAAPGAPGYGWATLCYRGGAQGCTAVLHQLQRCLRAYVPGRDGRFLTNTWGDRNRDGRISAAFMAEEIAAAPTIGAEVVQIDDGWQRGITANSVHREQGGVWQGFYAADDAFWSPHPTRFPAGLAATAAAVRERQMGFGLWFAPDSAHDFAHWERDATTVLQFWQEHGVTAVKIDGVKAHTALAEANLRRFFHRVLTVSGGAVVFDLDVTAEVRPGYFGAIEVGPLFVENRYTDWHRYWPHATFRNLWQLAHWIDPVRLRMEFLNNLRHAELYAGDPLAPAHYGADWLFASVMIACPLGWFEISNLPPATVQVLAPLVTVWKQHRDALHQGRILPMGDVPDGTTTSGFLSLSVDGTSAYLIVLRGLNTSHEVTWNVPLTGRWQTSRLAGQGTATVVDGRAVLTVDRPLGYLLVRLEPA